MQISKSVVERIISTATPCIRWGGGGGGRSSETSERSAAQHLAESADNVNKIGRVRELGQWREDETAEQELEGPPSPVGFLSCLFQFGLRICRVYLTLTCWTA